MSSLAPLRFASAGASRWDDELPDQAASAQNEARKARERMAMEIAQRESVHQHHAPSAAEMRARHAALYYDHHRAAQVAEANGNAQAVVDRHLRTRGIASALMGGEVDTIEATIALARRIAAKQGLDAIAQERAARDAAREYVLWRHSVALDDAHRFADVDTYKTFHRHLSTRGYQPTVDEARGLNASLDTHFGDMTRSPHLAYMALMKPKSGFGPAAMTVTDQDHPHVGSMALSHKATREDLTREFAQSLATRHLAPEFESFRDGLRRRTRGEPDHAKHYSDHGYRMGVGPAGDPLAEFGHAYARAIAGHTPATHPALAREFGPTRRSVEDLGAVMPGYSVHPGSFKSSAIEEDDDA